MKNCSYPECNEEEVYPFKCKLCNQYYCGKHRLAEQHDCPMVGFFQTDEYRKAKLSTTRIAKKETESRKTKRKTFVRKVDSDQKANYMKPEERFLMRSSFYTLYSFKTNMYNILIATAAVAIFMCLHLMFRVAVIEKLPVNILFPWPFLTVLFGVMVIFGGHLVLQKILSRHYGVHSSNVLWLQGLLLGIVSIFILFIIFPSFLVFRDFTAKVRERGKVALSGILWILGFQIFTIVTLLTDSFPFEMRQGLSIFPFLMFFYVLFNLIPIGLNNGQYIRTWNKKLLWSTIIANLVIFGTYAIVYSILTS